MTCSGLPFEYKELYGSAKESFNAEIGIWQAERIFHGPYLDRLKFVQTFLASLTSTILGQHTYTPAAEYPAIPLCRAYDVAIDGDGKATHDPVTDQITYDSAKVIVKYKTPPYQSGAQPDLITTPIDQLDFNYLTEEFDADQETLLIPERATTFVSASGQVHVDEVFAPMRYVVSSMHHIITQHFVKDINWPLIDLQQGTINYHEFITPSKRTLLIGGSLYLGPTGFRKFVTATLFAPGITGSSQFELNTAWEVTHRFHYKTIRKETIPVGLLPTTPPPITIVAAWNKKLNHVTGEFEPIVLANGIPPYARTDHRLLFMTP